MKIGKVMAIVHIVAVAAMLVASVILLAHRSGWF